MRRRTQESFGEQEEKVLEAFRKFCVEGVARPTTRDIQKRTKIRSRRSLNMILKSLVEKRKLVKRGNGTGSRYSLPSEEIKRLRKSSRNFMSMEEFNEVIRRDRNDYEIWKEEKNKEIKDLKSKVKEYESKAKEKDEVMAAVLVMVKCIAYWDDVRSKDDRVRINGYVGIATELLEDGDIGDKTGNQVKGALDFLKRFDAE